MEIPEAVKKRLHEMYEEHWENFKNGSQELIDIPPGDPRQVPVTVGFKISVQALHIVLLNYFSGEVWAGIVLDIMQTTFNLLRVFIRSVHRALLNAGPTLSRILCQTMNEFCYCTLDLLKCTISYEPYGSPSDRNRVPDLARKVANMFDSLVKCPKTNLAAMGNALALVANEMEIILREMENKAGSSTGQCDEPSRSNSEDTPEEERTLAEEIICVVHEVVQLIKELTELVKTWDDADDLPKSIRNMEDLLIRSIRIRDCVKEIKDCICVREVAKITEALRNTRIAVASFEKALDAVLAQPVHPTSSSC